MNNHIAVGKKLGGICRSKVFHLWRTGELKSVKIGRRRFSTDRQINDYIEQLEAEAMCGRADAEDQADDAGPPGGNRPRRATRTRKNGGSTTGRTALTASTSGPDAA